MKYIIFVCLFLLTGCASYSPNQVVIEIDPTYSPAVQQEILEALSDWSVKSQGTFNISTVVYPTDINYTPEFNVIKFINDNTTTENIAGSTLYIAGYTDYFSSTLDHPEWHIQAVIYIWNDLDQNLFVGTVRHEIGHALNLGHYCTEQQNASPWFSCQVVSVDPEPSIIYPQFNSAYLVVEPVDIYRFCEEWNCPQ